MIAYATDRNPESREGGIMLFRNCQNEYGLLDPETELGKDAAKRWEKEKTNFSESEKEWRWLIFVIKLTSEREKGVGPDADVLEVKRTGARWLHTASCK